MLALGDDRRHWGDHEGVITIRGVQIFIVGARLVFGRSRWRLMDMEVLYCDVLLVGRL